MLGPLWILIAIGYMAHCRKANSRRGVVQKKKMITNFTISDSRETFTRKSELVNGFETPELVVGFGWCAYKGHESLYRNHKDKQVTLYGDNNTEPWVCGPCAKFDSEMQDLVRPWGFEFRFGQCESTNHGACGEDEDDGFVYVRNSKPRCESCWVAYDPDTLFSLYQQ